MQEELPVSKIEDYHAHVYFDAATGEAARWVREAVERRFPAASMGRWHEKPVGPHPCWSYQIAFKPSLFAELVPWLALNRRDLTVFIHPNSGEEVEDHRDRALWLGEKQKLKLETLTA